MRLALQVEQRYYMKVILKLAGMAGLMEEVIVHVTQDRVLMKVITL